VPEKEKPAPIAPPPSSLSSPPPVPDFASLFANTRPREEPVEPAHEAELVDPEDVTFEGEVEAAYTPPTAPVMPPAAPVMPPPPPAMPAPMASAPPPRPAAPPPVARPEPQPSRPAMSVSQAAPLPDPTLTSDMAEELLAPATNAAVASTFSRLNGLATIGSAQTIEGLMREMLRPMLKEWLDENLPSVVERMVEKEIARISRGAK
jgi:cell pole-organizing protein PopZ